MGWVWNSDLFGPTSQPVNKTQQFQQPTSYMYHKYRRNIIELSKKNSVKAS